MTIANLVLTAEILVTSTIPGLHTRRADVPGDHQYGWVESGTMELAIADRDPFQHAPAFNHNGTCNGAIQPLTEVVSIIRYMDGADTIIMDDIVMDLWESRNDGLWWTPIAVCHTDLTRLRL